MQTKTLQPLCELILYSIKGVAASPERISELALNYQF